jgi:small conductance mechanosensitive channel
VKDTKVKEKNLSVAKNTKKSTTKTNNLVIARNPNMKKSEVLTISHSVENYAIQREKRHRKKNVLVWVFLAFAILFLVFSFIAPYLPLPDIFKDNMVNLSSIVLFVKNNLGVILRSMMTIIVFYIIINLLVLSVTKVSMRNKRAKTAAGMINSFIRYIGFFVLILTLLGVWGLNTTAILSGAALFSAVIALGAQSLVSDILAGIFMVFESNFMVGDIVTIDGFRGYVEEIGVRTTKIKAELGEVLIITNSQMKKIINQSMHRCGLVWAFTVNHDENVDRVEKIINDNIVDIGDRIPTITEGPIYLGVAEITPDGVVIKFYAKCDETVRYKTTRELNKEIKRLFDKNKIKFAVHKVEVSEK